MTVSTSVKLNKLPDSDFLTVKQISDHLGWHPNTVYLRCASGELRSFKSGNRRMVRTEAYKEWLAGMEGEQNAVEHSSCAPAAR